MKVSVIILNWNRKEDIIFCLKSISHLSVLGYSLSIVVVDNASSDNSQNEIKDVLENINKRNSWECELIENDKNLGFAGGNNVGIKHAINHGSDYILILNNDTRVDPALLIRIISTVKKYSNFGAASPKIYFEKGYEFHKDYKNSEIGKIIWYAGGVIDWDNIYGNCRGVDEFDKGQYDKVIETDFATGTCMFISRKALEEVGFFDEKYYMYYEDTDLSIRIRHAGLKLLYIPQAKIWHKVAQSSGIGSDLNDYFITRNRLLFGMKYASLRTRLALYRESQRLFWKGRPWQRRGVIDFYLRRFVKGSWYEK